MSSSERSRPGHTPMRRVVFWLIVAVAIVAGLVLFFRFGREIAPVLGGGQ